VSFLLLLAIGLLLNGAASLLALWRAAVNPSGAIAGVIIGTLIFACGGPLFWIILMLFFVSSTGLGYVRRADKEWLQTVHQKGGRRDMLQVIANGGVGAGCAVLFRLTGNAQWAVAFAVSFAASNADTWASEIGVLSQRRPRSLLTFRSVPRGISGGVSLLGTGMALAGAFLIGFAFAAENLVGDFLPQEFLLVALFVTAGGFLGSLTDSILGATMQAQYASPTLALSPDGETLSLTERDATPEGTPNRLVRGLSFVTNDVVNLASCALVTGAAVILWPLLG
jgi:uncharacterized protein (TIGR00297 family)